jgi:hypothetical protein
MWSLDGGELSYTHTVWEWRGLEDLEEKDESFSYWFKKSIKGVYRIAPAKPGLLKIVKSLYAEKRHFPKTKFFLKHNCTYTFQQSCTMHKYLGATQFVLQFNNLKATGPSILEPPHIWLIHFKNDYACDLIPLEFILPQKKNKFYILFQDKHPIFFGKIKRKEYIN